jgi:hypothetical protein
MALFTAETAKLAAARSHSSASARFQRVLPPVKPDSQPLEADKFRLARLAIVRAQLVKIDKMFWNESDPQKLDKLASATTRLSEQERILSRTTLPGTDRPRQGKRPAISDEPLPEWQPPVEPASPASI